MKKNDKRKLNLKKSIYETEVKAEDPITEEIKAKQEAWEARKSVVEESLGVKLGTIEKHLEYWRFDISQIVPKNFRISKNIKDWVTKESKSGNALTQEEKIAIIEQQAEPIFRFRLIEAINALMPQSALFLIPEDGPTKAGRRKRQKETGKEDPDVHSSDHVIYINKRLVDSFLTRDPKCLEGASQKLQAVLARPIDELQRDELASAVRTRAVRREVTSVAITASDLSDTSLQQKRSRLSLE